MPNTILESDKGLVTNLIQEVGLQNGRGGHVKFYPYEKRVRKRF